MWRAEGGPGQRGACLAGQQETVEELRDSMRDTWVRQGGPGRQIRGCSSSPELQNRGGGCGTTWRRGKEASEGGVGPGRAVVSRRHAKQRRGRPVGEGISGGAVPARREVGDELGGLICKR